MSKEQLRLFEPEESKQPEHTPENCEELANYIVGGMTVEELMQFVYDDVVHIMYEDKEVFLSNAEQTGLWEDELDSVEFADLQEQLRKFSPPQENEDE